MVRVGEQAPAANVVVLLPGAQLADVELARLCSGNAVTAPTSRLLRSNWPVLETQNPAHRCRLDSIAPPDLLMEVLASISSYIDFVILHYIL